VTTPFPAYSYRYFAGLVSPGANQVLQNVPAGKRFVINYMSGTATATGSSQLLVYLSATGIELTRLNGAAAGAVAYWTGRLVLHEGEHARLRAIVGDWVVSVHGFLLTGAGGPILPGTLPA